MKKIPFKDLSKEQKKFINTFSWGGFFAPTIMYFYTKQYKENNRKWNLVAILGHLPHLSAGDNFRKKAYKNLDFDNFESYIEKIKKIEIIGIITYIIPIIIGIFILIIYKQEILKSILQKIFL